MESLKSLEVPDLVRQTLMSFNEEQKELLKIVGTASAVALSLYLFLRLVVFRSKSSDFSNRLVSTLHGLLALSYSTYLVKWNAPFDEIGRQTEILEAQFLAVSLGYFLYDFFVCLFIEEDITTHLHHIASICGLVLGSIYKKGGAELLLCLFIAEATNPMQHMHYIMKELKYKGPLANMNDLLFAIIFFIARMCFGPVLVYRTVMSPTSPLFVKISGVALEVVSVFWFYKIVKIFLYKIRGGSRKKKD